MSLRYHILAADAQAVSLLRQEFGLPGFIASTLVARGIKSPSEVKAFLSPSLDRDWLDPYLIPGLSDVADLIGEAIKDNRHIVVFGDFDLDGISATATLTRGLRSLGARVTPFVPLRFQEGYGITEVALQRVFALKPDLIVTVDCGIANKKEAEIIKQAGIAFAVTDHHEPADLVPIGVPIANPKMLPDCPSSILAGVGVALKLVQVLGCRFGQPYLWRDYTDLATLGTVADLMPMVAENRALVADGIARMKKSPRSCIAALLATAGAADKEITAANMSFSIIPRLNAAGRMGDAQPALDLLLAEDFEEACEKAKNLESINDHRRLIEAELSEVAKSQAAEIYKGQRALVVSGEGWHEGVKGIVASRLVNVYGVPTILFTIDGNEARGSGRSVGQVNLFKAVESTADILTRFGGHEAAVGVTLPTDKLPEFTERLNTYMQNLDAESFLSRVTIDTCVDLKELTIENVEALQSLAPFGQENTIPRFLARDVILTNTKIVGADKNHFSCIISDGKNSLSGIMFHCPDIEGLMCCDSVVNAAFELQIDEWRGRRTVKAIISSLTPARACCALEACLDPEISSFLESMFSQGCNISIGTEQPEDDKVDKEEAIRLKSREYWHQKATENPDALQSSIVQAIIGDQQLHNAQSEVLRLLDKHESVLAVMPTGRGKSLLFYVYAACIALREGKASLFIYPLRALISDQAFHISEALEPFGISCAVLTGESSHEERSRVYDGLASGGYDIVLTTPEYLAFNVHEFVQAGNIGLVVVDEAHHIGLARAGQRMAYAQIGTMINSLGKPVVLALTATADNEVASVITKTLGIGSCVYDSAVRKNLLIDDQRNLKNRDSYIANLIATGEKTVIYVNSREQSVFLARAFRKLVPQIAPLIGFYNAGLSRIERNRIEELFRTDALCVLIATSAFGEGVNIPNIRHVVLYHLPFNDIEFNQISGRAGRDGQHAVIHILFSRKDADINEKILYDMTPDHDCLAQIYRELRRIQQGCERDSFAISNEELAEVSSKGGRIVVSSAAVACGIAVFQELGLIEAKSCYESGKSKQYVRVVDVQSKVELTDSVRYCEGIKEREVFYSFRDWIMKSAERMLQARISKAILPVDSGTDNQ